VLESFFSRSPHLPLAHSIWKEHLKKGDFVLDATTGNGHDTAFVAPLIFPEGKLIALDVQSSALEKAKTLLNDQYPIEWILESHASYPEKLEDNSVDLAIYNLGYLPGSDKNCITTKKSTEKSLFLMLHKLKKGGILSVTTYSGHPGGEEEETFVETFLKSLERNLFGVISFSWSNRPKSPKLFVVKKL